MATFSVDLRERILSAYDAGTASRVDVAKRFKVSLGFVKKLLQQRRKTKDIRPRHRFSGRKRMIVDSHRRELRRLISQKPDMTLAELRTAMKIECTLPAIHYVLQDMGLTYKKRRSQRASKTGPTSAKRGASGSGAKAGSTRPGSSSSTSRGPKRT
jgi:transposase